MRRLMTMTAAVMLTIASAVVGGSQRAESNDGSARPAPVCARSSG
jgi:hypothetical protein